MQTDARRKIEWVSKADLFFVQVISNAALKALLLPYLRGWVKAHLQDTAHGTCGINCTELPVLSCPTLGKPHLSDTKSEDEAPSRFQSACIFVWRYFILKFYFLIFWSLCLLAAWIWSWDRVFVCVCITVLGGLDILAKYNQNNFPKILFWLIWNIRGFWF